MEVPLAEWFSLIFGDVFCRRRGQHEFGKREKLSGGLTFALVTVRRGAKVF